MTAAGVMHARQLRPARTVETEDAPGIRTEAVPAGDVDVVVEGGRGRVVQPERQARARAPRLPVNHPDGPQAVAGRVQPAEAEQVATGAGRPRPPGGARQ